MAMLRSSTGEPDDQRYAPMAEINVTPMVDVMLVLLVIFMVTAPLLMVGVPLDLPKTKAAAIVAPKEPLIVSLDRQGAMFIGDDPVPAATNGHAPEGAVRFVGNGSNIIYVDWQDDIVAVFRWIRNDRALDDVIGKMMGSMKTTSTTPSPLPAPAARRR